MTVPSLTSSLCLSAASSSAHPGIAPQSLTPAPSHCAFQETSVSVWGVYGWGIDCLILILFRLPQISCFILSLKCFSSNSDNCPHVGIGPRLQFPYPPRFFFFFLLFFPLVLSSYRGLRGSIYSFTLVRYTCPLSAGVLHVLLSEGVFLIYTRREKYSMSTYFSAIFSP